MTSQKEIRGRYNLWHPHQKKSNMHASHDGRVK